MPKATVKITIGVIATRLKLSKATISKALSPHTDRSDISADTSARVRAAAARMGWRPDEQRAARARRRIGNIGLVCQRTSPFTGGVYGNFLDGLGTALATHGRRLLFVPTLDVNDWSRLLTDQRIDGAILMEPIGEPLMRLIADTRFPAVLINQTTTLNLPQVLCDDAYGIGLAVNRLTQAGHRRLAFVHSPYRAEHYSVTARIAGFHAACARLDLRGEDCADEAAKFLDTWLKETPATRATAVIGYNFADTLDLIVAALSAGIAIPDALSVISGDDLEVLSLLRPPVTAVRVPMIDMARQAVALLIELIEGNRRQSNGVNSVPPILIERGTVATPWERPQQR